MAYSVIDYVKVVFFFNVTATTENYTYLHTLSLHAALPISPHAITRTGTSPRRGEGVAMSSISRCGRSSARTAARMVWGMFMGPPGRYASSRAVSEIGRAHV